LLAGFAADLGELPQVQREHEQGKFLLIQLLVKWANGMEAYQLRITKNYLPPSRKPTQKKGKKQTALKIEEKQEVKL
jgi:hypothetical protein